MRVTARRYACCICELLLTKGVCKSCGHSKCSSCPPLSPRKSYAELESELSAWREQLLMAHQEMDALHAKLARMSAPVSGYEHLEYSDGECNLYEREDVNALIAARAQEVKHG